MRVRAVLARLFPVLSVVVAFAPSLAAGPLDLRVELLTGEFLPGTYAELERVFHVRPNDAGEFVFLADVKSKNAGIRKRGVFVKRGEEVRMVVLQHDVLPGGARFLSSDDSVMLDLNNGGTVAILIKEGILLKDANGLRWLVQAGSNVPGTSLSIQELVVPSAADYSSLEPHPYPPFLNEENSVAFKASLSDGRVGVFRASSTGSIVPVLLPGDPRPGRTGPTFGSPLYISQMELAGDSLLLRVWESGSFAGVYLHRAGVLRTIITTGDSLPEAGAVGAVGEAAANSAGLVAVSLVAGEPAARRLVIWSTTEGIKRVLSQSDLPGFGQDRLGDLVDLSLDESGRLFFAAAGGIRNFIYTFDGQDVQKIVADGDSTPLGGTFSLPAPAPSPVSIGLPPPRPPSVYLELTPTNGYGEVVFMASVTGGDNAGRMPFLWSHGLLLPVPFKNEVVGGIGERIVWYLGVWAFDGSTLLLSASLCCDGAVAVLAASSALPKRSYVPLIAQGVAGSVDYITSVDLVNRSPFPGFALLEPRWEDGSSPGLPFSAIRFLAPGSVTRVSFESAAPVVRGYVEVTIEGGAHVSPVASVKVRERGVLLSKTVLPAVTARTEVNVPIERAGGEKAFAVSNPGDSPNQILLELMDATGSVEAAASRDLLPGHQESFLFADLFPGTDPSFLGHIRAHSDKPFLLSAFSLTGFQLATVPLSPESSRAPRDWGFKNVYPGEVDRVVASRSGTVAFITVDHEDKTLGSYKLIALRDGQVYEVLRQQVRTKEGGTFLLPPQPMPRPIGFSADDHLYFLAKRSGDPYGYLGLFEWVPGRTDQILTSHDRLPDGSGPLFGGLSACAVGTDGYVYFSAHVLDGSGLLTGTSIYRYDGSFHKLFSLPRGAGISEISENEGAITAHDTSGLWFFRHGQLHSIVEMAMTSTGEQVGDVEHAKISDAGKVYFVTSKGLYMWDGTTTTKVAAPGDPAPGLAGYVFETVGLGESQEVLRRSAFKVNTKDHLVYPARLRNPDGDWYPVAFFRVDTTASQQTVLVFPGGSFDPRGWYISDHRDYEWTDDDELIFSYRSWSGGGERTVAVGPNGTRTLLSGAMSFSSFNDPLLSFGSVLDLWSSAEPAAALLSLYNYGAEPSGLYQTVPDNLEVFIFPVVSTASSPSGNVAYNASFLFENTDPRDARVVLRFYDSDGAVVRSVERTVAGLASQIVPVSGLGETYSGWTRVEATGGRVRVLQRLSYHEGAKLVSQYEVAGTGPRSAGYFAGPREDREVSSVAVVNPYNAPQEVIIDMLGSGFGVERQARFALGPNARKAVYLSELFGNLDFRSRLFRFRSSLPVSLQGVTIDSGCLAPYGRF